MSTTAPVNQVLEAEADNYNDADSAVGSDTASSITSVTASILAYRKENGRTYHAYKDGKYLIPNDEEENDRLDLQHHLFCLTFQNRLYDAPIPKEKMLNRVLDLGTGTGIWAMDFADEHPESEVVGLDLSPIQPIFVAPNLNFEIDDMEEEWTCHTKFDFIHGRMLTGCIANWPKLVASIYDNLTPGGWVQFADIYNDTRSDDHTQPPDCALVKWNRLILEGGEKMGRTCGNGPLYKGWLDDAGFEGVVERVYRWPINRWPRDPRMKEIGMWALENVTGGISGLSMALFTRVLGWNADDVEVFLRDVRTDLRDTRIHAYWPIYVVYGRKPEGEKV